MVRPSFDRRPTKSDLRSNMSMVYGEELDGDGSGRGATTPGGFSASVRSFTTNLTEMNKSFRRMASFKVDSDKFLRIPKTLRLDFDFYRVMFLNIRNENFTVSTMQVLLSFERLSRLIGADLKRETVKGLVSLQDENQMITWDKYADFVDSFERMSPGPNRINPGATDAVFALDKETALVLTLPERITLTIEHSSSSSLATFIGFVRIGIILLSTIGIIIDSEPGLRQVPECSAPPCLGEPVSAPFLDRIELATVIAFTIDYLIRLSLAGFIRGELLDRPKLLETATGRHSLSIHTTFWNRIFTYVFSFISLVDIVSVIPFYVRLALESSASGGLQIFRVIRLVNVIRLLRIKQFREIRIIIVRSFSESLSALAVLIVAFTIVILCFGVLIYFQEAGEWFPLGTDVPGYGRSIGAYYRRNSLNSNAYELTPFKSVLLGMWFAIVSATTTGYGDMYPASTVGKLIGSVLVMAGVVVLALPIAIIGSNFTNEFQKHYAIRHMLTMHKDKKIQNTVMAQFLESLNEEEQEMADANLIFNSDEGLSLVNPDLEIKLQGFIGRIENSSNLIDRLEVVGHAKTPNDVKSFLSWALGDLDALKGNMSTADYSETRDTLVAIAFDVLRKLPKNNTN